MYPTPACFPQIPVSCGPALLPLLSFWSCCLCWGPSYHGAWYCLFSLPEVLFLEGPSGSNCQLLRPCSNVIQLVTTFHWLTLLHLSYILVPFSPHYLPLVTCFFIRFLFVSHDLLVSFWGQRFSSTSLPLNLQCHQCLVKLNEWLDGFLPCTPEGFILEGRHGWQSSKPINGLFISDEKVKQRYGIGVMKKRGTEDGCHRRLSDVWRHSMCLEQSEQ